LLVPLSVNNKLSLSIILLILQFGITAWINLLLFSWIDKSKDEKDKHRSFATTFGSKATQRVLMFLFSIVAILTVIQLAIFSLNRMTFVVLSLMAMFLLWIFLKKDYFEKEDRYRLLGDAVFLLPIVYLILAK
jgi:1,4-dihydroxy-2-naphthoate octaprenyltransferase